MQVVIASIGFFHCKPICQTSFHVWLPRPPFVVRWQRSIVWLRCLFSDGHSSDCNEKLSGFPSIQHTKIKTILGDDEYFSLNSRTSNGQDILHQALDPKCCSTTSAMSLGLEHGHCPCWSKGNASCCIPTSNRDVYVTSVQNVIASSFHPRRHLSENVIISISIMVINIFCELSDAF